jgi:hypothetical protein
MQNSGSKTLWEQKISDKHKNGYLKKHRQDVLFDSGYVPVVDSIKD